MKPGFGADLAGTAAHTLAPIHPDAFPKGQTQVTTSLTKVMKPLHLQNTHGSQEYSVRHTCDHLFNNVHFPC